MKTANRTGSLVRTYFAVGAAICLLAIIQTQVQTQALLKLRTRYKWVILIVLFAVNLCVGVYLAARGPQSSVRSKPPVAFAPNRAVALIVGVVLILLPVWVFLLARRDFFGLGLEGFFRLLWLFWWLVLAQATGLRMAAGWGWERAMASAMLADGLAAQVFTLGTAVSAYPFSIGWSEASRYYYGSLVFSKALYGEFVPLSVMHGTRYLLQSIPFVMGTIPLWAARLWQVVLWIGLTSLSVWATIRRLGIRNRVNAALVGGWLFLFFFQGAVYYHLQVCVLVVMLGVSMNKRWRSMLAVVMASVWAGMSRVNWFPVPAMLAIALYLLETPYDRDRHSWRYLRLPLLWGVLGVASAIAGQALYVAISGNTDLEAFASSFTSELLWYRWWPSATNAIGIIPGVVIVSVPLMALIIWRRHAEPGGLHRLRQFALGGLLVMLLAGGLVVSTKIGGGGDLHNMDAYLVLLAMLGAYSLKGSARLEGTSERSRPAAPWSILTLMVLVPVALSLVRLGERFSYDPLKAGADLQTLGHQIQGYARGGDVLFMYERHLQAFEMVPRVRMVPDYEVVTLMEMAISHNEKYLGKFYKDLQDHRFAAIVAHPQNLGVETGDFIEENDAWNEWVARPLLCQYKPAVTLQYSKIQILIPRDRPCVDFPPSPTGL